MENALHVTNIRKLKYFLNGKFQRIYWGNEFCQKLIPCLKDTDAVLRFAKESRCKFTLVTPLVTDSGLKSLKNIFSHLKNKRIECEVIVNDWGVLSVLQSGFRKYFELALGRLLTRQEREPEINRVINKQPPLAMRDLKGNIHVFIHRPPGSHYQKAVMRSYIDSPVTHDLLYKFGIKRVELNNIVHGLDLAADKLKKSIYTPYVHIATTRFCPMETELQKMFRINVCNMECQRYYDVLRKKKSMDIYKRGNTVFYENPLKIKEISSSGVDRIVFQPELPF